MKDYEEGAGHDKDSGNGVAPEHNADGRGDEYGEKGKYLFEKNQAGDLNGT